MTDAAEGPAKDDKLETLVCTTMTEGHRLASDYFLDGLVEVEWKPETTKDSKSKKEQIPAHWSGTRFRERLRDEFGVKEVKKGKTYFIWPETWWNIFRTIFKYDPSSLVHGVMFAKEQIKIPRMLSAHMEARGAARVARSGVKFDRLGKTTSGQPIFAAEDETAHSILGTFIFDLALLRSCGSGKEGLSEKQKRLLLDLALWKVKHLVEKPFRFRTGCYLQSSGIAWTDDSDGATSPKEPCCMPEVLAVDITSSIKDCDLDRDVRHKVYYPAADLFTPPKDDDASGVTPENTDQSSESGDGLHERS